MTYTKQHILDIFNSIGYPTNMNGSLIPTLTSADYKRVDKEMFYCPKCKNVAVRVLVRVNNVWACVKCNKTELKTSDYKKARAHLITNDLFAYFGDTVETEQLFDAKAIEGFMKFCNLEKSPWHYLAFMQLHEAIMDKELSLHKILPFMSQKRDQLNQMLKKPEKLEEKKETA